MTPSLPLDHTEVAIIGGGLAGLAAAWALRDRVSVVLEADDRVGGRLISLPREPYWLNLGAGVFSGEESPVRALIREVGLTTREIPGNMMGLVVGKTFVTSGRVEMYPLRLPLSLAGRISFLQAGAKIRLAVSQYNRLAEQRPGETAEAAEARLFAFEGDRSFKEFLGRLHPEAEAIFRCTAANRIGTELEDLSATGGIGTYAYQFSGKASHLSHNLMGGSGRLPEALAAKLEGRIFTGAAVERVKPGRASVTVTYSLDGEPRRLEAKAAIVATPADIAHTLIQPLPPGLIHALTAVRYGQAVLVAMLTGEEGAMPYDNVYALSTPQRRFTILINVASTLRGTGKRQPGGSLLAYAGGNLARAYMDRSDEAIEQEFLDELYQMYPETRGIVRETRIKRWDRIVPYSFPGRYKLQPAFDQPMERVFLAGDYLGNWANMEVAVASGQRAAKQARALLQ